MQLSTIAYIGIARSVSPHAHAVLPKVATVNGGTNARRTTRTASDGDGVLNDIYPTTTKGTKDRQTDRLTD